MKFKMAKDTKDTIVRTVLNIASENGKLTIEEISKRSYITRTTIKNNFKKGVPEIIEYSYLNIIQEVNIRLFKYKCEDVSLELFADIALPILWSYREHLRIIYTKLPFRLTDLITEETFGWAKVHFDTLVKEHNLSKYFSGKDLLRYFHGQLITVLTLWLGADISLNFEVFKPKFIYLMSTSINSLIFETNGSISEDIKCEKRQNSCKN